MMNCSDIQEWFGVYFDLPEQDSRRISVDAHIAECPACAEEFDIWAESAELIRGAAAELPPLAIPRQPVASTVMSRIYAVESWRMPVADRIYAIPYRLRRNLMAVFAFFIALFLFTFLHSLLSSGSTDPGDGLTPSLHQVTKSVAPARASSMDAHTMSSATASTVSFKVVDPLSIGPVHYSYTDYFLAISLLGFICVLLIMNWLSRTRS